MQLADSIRKARQVKNKLSHPSCAAVIGRRRVFCPDGGTDKLLAELGGLPVLSRTLRVFDDHEMIDTIIVVAREDRMPKISRSVRRIGRCASSFPAERVDKSR